MSEQPTKKPTLTNRVGSLEQSMDATKATLQKLTHEVTELNRKSRGTTHANARAAKLERDVSRLNDQIQQLESRKEILGEHMTPAQSEAILGDLSRLDGQAKAFHADIQGQLDALKGDVADHEERISAIETGDIFSQLERDNEERDNRLSIVATSTAQAHERIDDHEVRITRFEQIATNSVAPLVLGVVAAIITFVFVNPNSTRNIWWEIGVSAAVGAIVAGIVSFFGNRVTARAQSITSRARRSESSSAHTQTTSMSEADRTTSTNRSSAPANDPDRTERMPVHEQA